MNLAETLDSIWKDLSAHIKRALDLWERQLNYLEAVDIEEEL